MLTDHLGTPPLYRATLPTPRPLLTAPEGVGDIARPNKVTGSLFGRPRFSMLVKFGHYPGLQYERMVNTTEKSPRSTPIWRRWTTCRLVS